MSEIYLSIVIPAYNEEKRLPESLKKIKNFLRKQPFAAEILANQRITGRDSGLTANRNAHGSTRATSACLRAIRVS